MRSDCQNELSEMLNCEPIELLNGAYKEIAELIGIANAELLYRHYRGCKIDCPKYFYNLEYVVEKVGKVCSKKEVKKIAILSGYSMGWIERKIKKHRS